MKIFLYTYETENMPSTHKLFPTLDSAKAYLCKEIGEYIASCFEIGDCEFARDFINNASITEERIDDTVYCFESGEEVYYIEELEVEG